MKLYHHKTSGGAEYLTDKFIVCPNGENEGVFEGANFIVRIDGDITKDAELTVRTQPDNEDAQEILAILKQAQKDAEAVRRETGDALPGAVCFGIGNAVSAATTLLEQRRKLVVACRALVQELKCYTEVHKADEDDEQALTLATEALRGLQ